MGYLKFGKVPSPDGNNDEIIFNSDVVTLRRHNNKNIDLIYNVQYSGSSSPDMGIGQVRLQGEFDWTNAEIAIINDAIITAQSQDFVNVQFNSSQNIKMVDINPANP